MTDTPTEEHNLGTAKHAVYNPTALMWAFLVGLPLTLLFMILLKVGG